MSSELRVVVANPSSINLREVIGAIEPRVDLVWEPELLAPMRHHADFPGDPSFRRTPEQQRRFTALLESAEVLYGLPDLDPAVLRSVVRANPGLRWVQTMAAGGGSQVRVAALTPDELDRVVVTTAAGVHAQPLADFAIFGLLAGVKDLPRLAALKAGREWSKRVVGRELRSLRVVVVGLGGIGRLVAQRLTDWGCHVTGVNTSGRPFAGAAATVAIDHVDDVLGDADAVVLALPDTDATRGLFDDTRLELLPAGAILVNVGRGSTVDEKSLIERLVSGRIGFAALDVFAVEPLPGDSPLWELPNVVVSPHSAALTGHEEYRIASSFAANATRFLDGVPLESRMDPKAFY